MLTRILWPTFAAALSVAMFAVTSSPATAQGCCTHLGGSVQCPAALPAGSRSLQFQEGGTLWQLPSGGTVFVPRTTFPACTPATGQPAQRPSGSAPVEAAPASQPATAPSTSQPATTAPSDAPRGAGTSDAPPARVSPADPTLPHRGRAAQDRARDLIDGRPVIVVPAPAPPQAAPTDIDDRIRRLGQELQRGDRTVPRGAPGVAPPAEATPGTPVPPEKPGQAVGAPAECRLDLAVHRPISQDPAQPRVPRERQFEHGAFTLRNDDADAPVGRLAAGHALPVTTLPTTDLDVRGNPLENDLVRVRASNPDGLKNVYLFAFTLAAEADTRRATSVNRTRVPAPQSSPRQLATWSDAFKTAPAPAFAIPVGAGDQDLWVEGRLGGRYVLALGIVPEQAPPGRFRYLVEGDRPVKPVIPAVGDTPAVELGCLQQARLTVVVVDIFQRAERTVRENAFDVYWGGIPHFHAAVWPGGGRYAWAADYRRGADLRQVPGRAHDGRAGASPAGPAPGNGVGADALASGELIAGLPVTSAGTAGAPPGGAGKAEITGGLAVHAPTLPLDPAPVGDRLGRALSPQVNRNAADLYPHRVSVAYTLSPGTAQEETLVRAEPLEVILPQLGRIPDAQPRVSERPLRTAFGVRSTVEYTISDTFGRAIHAPGVREYLLLYGAALMAWEALWPEEGHARETADAVEVVDLPPNTDPFRIGTAQRTQAFLYRSRMTEGRFRDTLSVSVAGGDNRIQEYWQHWTGRTARPRVDAFRRDVAERGELYRKAAGNAAEQSRLREQDGQSASENLLFRISQDVVLQLRTADALHDIRALRGNGLSVYFPYIPPGMGDAMHDPSPWVYGFWLAFQPGADTRPVLLPPDFLVGNGGPPSPRDR